MVGPWLVPSPMVSGEQPLPTRVQNTQLAKQPYYSTRPSYPASIIKAVGPSYITISVLVRGETIPDHRTASLNSRCKNSPNVAACDAKKVPFGVFFVTNIRSDQILPTGHSLVHLSMIVPTYVSMANGKTYPNGAQNTRLRNLKKPPTIKPLTHKKAALYNLADRSTHSIRTTHQEGPSLKGVEGA